MVLSLEIRLAGIRYGSHMLYCHEPCLPQDKPLSKCSVLNSTQDICPILSGPVLFNIFGDALSCLEAPPLAFRSKFEMLLLEFHI